MQDYKSVCAAVIVPTWLTSRQTSTHTDSIFTSLHKKLRKLSQ